MIDLSRKQVLISGGTPALSGGIAASLRKAGATAQLLQNSESHAGGTDAVPDQRSADAQLAAFDRIDTLLILPAYYTTGFFMESDTAEWDETLSANYARGVWLAQAAAKHMIERGVQGSIIFISTVAIEMPLMQTSSYATSLAALYPLAKMAAVECAPYGIRVNTVTTGWLEHEWTAAHLKDETARNAVKADIPLATIGTPEMIGEVCCFLASSLARYITGAIIPVDGGYSLTRSDGDSPYPLS